MKRDSEIRKIAFIGDYLPRKCGIATFTHDLCTAVATQYPSADCFVVPVNDTPQGYDYPPEVRFEFDENDLDSYLRAADFLNFSNTDVVCLQHEYGIFGGPAGSHILGLLRNLRVPVVTTLHTVLREPNADQRRVLRQLGELSARIVVMTERGRTFLREIYEVPESKIELIAHGIPDIPFVDPNFYKDQFGVEGKYVILTFGLLSPDKGIESMLRALPEIVHEFPNLVYIVLGATHPNLVREQGESYRIGLERLAKRLGIKKHVIFYNRFVELNELTEFIGAADIYVTPYLNPAQITSGTLAYTFGSGKAVVSTPYWHAEELLANGRGVLVGFSDSAALAHEIIGLLRDPQRRLAMCKKAYLVGREMIWSHVAHLYVDAFERGRRGLHEQAERPPTVRTPEEQQAELPDWRLDHLVRMTEATGMFQHASFTIPTFTEGYCTDDNARALLLTVLLEELGQDGPEVLNIATTYTAFLQAAFDPALGRFRNFMSFDRQWLEGVGSHDSHGRALVPGGVRRAVEAARLPILGGAALRPGAAGGDRILLAPGLGLRPAGDQRVFPPPQRRPSRRAGARHLGRQAARTLREDRDRGLALVRGGPELRQPPTAARPDRQRTIRGGRQGAGGRAPLAPLADGAPDGAQGHFRPIGSNGFHQKGRERPAQFDQQPVEAYATVEACLAAYRVSDDATWLRDARMAFDWFLGHNDLGLPLYDPYTGGCRDGLQQDRVNQNQGAESTLSFLLALAEMKLMEGSLAVFRQATEADPMEFNYLM